MSVYDNVDLGLRTQGKKLMKGREGRTDQPSVKGRGPL